MVDTFSVSLSSGPRINLTTVPSSSGTRNYERLENKPQINGVTLTGNLTSEMLGIVSENTSAGWAGNPLYTPRAGEICLYTDLSKVKIGDGLAPIVDLPFIVGAGTEEVMEALMRHANDADAHVSAQDRMRWDAKLNYTVNDETIIFNRE